MDKNSKVIFLILFSVILASSIYFLFNKPYDRIDVIDKDEFSFRLERFLPRENIIGQAYAYSKKSDIAIDKIPNNMTIKCNNREGFIISIENKDSNVARNIEFLIENAENLVFEYPKDFVVPPLSTKEMTLFIDVDCSNAPRLLNPIFKVKDAQLEFNFSIYVENRSE
ncbi:hypothetical protein HYW19_00430 [Candidatus Woesearchaeota archaeon]|nr:hypothetical protein [Candidatus Woesearchaeota archaeon]